MRQSPHIPVVAIINTSEEITSMLTSIFQMEGFQTVAAYVPGIKRGQPDIGAFLSEHHPDVVLWDIGIPYEENWGFFQSVQQSEIGRPFRFVLTTTNKAALERLVGPTPTHEIMGKPYDIDQLVEAVRRALGRSDGEQ